MTADQKRALIADLKALWAQHDTLEREILLLERKLTDKELRRLGAAAGG